MLANVTFFGNSAITDGGGIYNYNIDPDPASLPSVTNSILWGNIPNQMTNVNTSFASVSYCDIQDGNISGNNINTNPLLSPLADNGGFSLTHSLGVGSPAIDTGNQAICTDTDQRGFQRPMDGNGDGLSICDMGAYEVEYEPRLYLPIVTK